MFRWLERTFGGRLYGPYEHGGRRYYQWMVRGRQLREELFPALAQLINPEVDSYSSERFEKMADRYAGQLRPRADQVGGSPDTDSGAE